jgi:hypothetical protein
VRRDRAVCVPDHVFLWIVLEHALLWNGLAGITDVSLLPPLLA